MRAVASGAHRGFLTVGGARLEYAWHGPPPGAAPTLVFLHEGLGSVSAWRGFPARLADAAGCGALVYSRGGYGASDPVPLPRPATFMHAEADVLAAVMDAVDVREAILFGHSDGASVALLHAAGHPDGPVRGLVLEAPHVFVEEVTVESIARLRDAFPGSVLRERLSRHHADVDATVAGWCGVWLDPGFRAWNLAPALSAIRIPSLVIQGDADEYGTWAQVEAIQRGSGGSVDVLRVADCGHAPHQRDPDVVEAATVRFVRRALRR